MKNKEYIYDLMLESYHAERTCLSFINIGDEHIAEIFFFYACILEYEFYLLTVKK